MFFFLNPQMAANYDIEREKEAREWIEELTGETLQGPPGAENFHLALKNGQVLCK